MRHGLKVVDADTHVNPSLEVLLRYADRALLDRLDELEPHKRTTVGADGAPHTQLNINALRYNRVAGSAPSDSARLQAGGATMLDGRLHMRTAKPIAAGVSDDNACGRLADMDEEGRDVDVIIPGAWAYGASALEPGLACALFAAYHRYIADYCSADARRLKSFITVPAADVAWSVAAIDAGAREDWAAAVWPVLPEGLPLDHPDLEPIWAAANRHDLPVVYHGFTVQPPYFPGYRDIWDNAVMGRAAGQTWGGQRFLTFMLISGILDRYPNLRVAVLETGHGWLPHWIARLEHQLDYIRGQVPADLRHTPSEYVKLGRVFCGIDYSEGLELTRATIELLGEDVLLYESDYPHPETSFPDTTDIVLGWQARLGASATRKLMADNAARLYRFTTTPWEQGTARDEVAAR